MAEKKLLLEQFWDKISIHEDVGSEPQEKRIRVVGVVQEAEKLNQNRRIYKREVLEAALKNLQERVAEGKAFGELDHPETKGKLKETSHIIKKIEWGKENPNEIVAEMVILNTPSGQILKEILKAGGRPGFSSRGYGEIEKELMDGIGEVEKVKPGFYWEGIDFVIDPSLRTAQIHDIIESAERADKKLQEEKMNEITLEKLKAEHPEIVKALRDEWEAEDANETKELEKKEEEKEPMSVEEQAPTPDSPGEAPKEPEEKPGEDNNENALYVIDAIIDLLREAGFLVDEEGEEEPEEPEEEEDFFSTTEEERERIAEILRENRDLQAKLQTLLNEKTKLEIAGYIEEKTKGLEFGQFIAERLRKRDLKSKEEVDKYIEEDLEFAKRLISEDVAVTKVTSKEVEKFDKGSSVEDELDIKIKALGGIKIKKEK